MPKWEDKKKTHKIAQVNGSRQTYINQNKFERNQCHTMLTIIRIRNITWWLRPPVYGIRFDAIEYKHIPRWLLINHVPRNTI